MENIKFVLNTAAVGELLKSAEMASLVSEVTDRQAAAAGGEGRVFIGFDRVHGIVTGVRDD